MKTKTENTIKNITKANMLLDLKPKLQNAFVEEIYVFTVKQWEENPSEQIKSIQNYFTCEKLVVRSSSKNEDCLTYSKAGYFDSVLNVNPDEVSIAAGVQTVIDSYRNKGEIASEDQILIQSQTMDVKICGVLFTRQLGTNAPYYVINYDETSGKTDTVTAGLVGKTCNISYFAEIFEDSKWYSLLKAVKEVETLLPERILDIEFAITHSGQVVIFQVRPLAANKDVVGVDDEFVEHLINDMSEKFMRYSKCESHLAGDFTLFGDMPDWNPSEIIGSRPNTLDYTIYSFIVTDEVWHEARTSLGYYDVFPAELMVSFGKKPYIDTRISFNSLTPKNISHSLRTKLIHFYLNKLKINPAYQDKVEFNILWTCYDFSTSKQLDELKQNGFTDTEVSEFDAALKSLTKDLLRNYTTFAAQDLDMVRFLTQRCETAMEFYESKPKSPWTTLNTAYNILQNCKRYGTLPFSRQARFGFIAKSLMYSLKTEGFITHDFEESLFHSINTIASEFGQDSALFSQDRMSESEFLKKYGHLRSGTYDVTALRYDQMENFKAMYKNKSVISSERQKIKQDNEVWEKVTGLVKRYDYFDSVDELFEFVRQATANREYAKYEFTKSLSNALELIAQAGEMLGFDRNELCHADWPTLMKFRNPEKGDHSYAKKIIFQSIDRHKRERTWYNTIILPPVITSVEDFYIVEPYQAEPNFITLKMIEGDVLLIDDINAITKLDLSNKIILLENADPGYDWVFAKNPKGIVTKYGGVASHIAIRCAEFGIPAAIGCGDLIYDKIRCAQRIVLDCDKKNVTNLT